MNICRHCKVREGTARDSTYIKASGEIIYRYTCRTCNTERVKKYRKTPRGRRLAYAAVYRSIEKLKYKQIARYKVAKALKEGTLTKALACACGTTKVEAHHEDYTKPLEVIWLCRQCHSTLHRIRLNPATP